MSKTLSFSQFYYDFVERFNPFTIIFLVAIISLIIGLAYSVLKFLIAAGLVIIIFFVLFWILWIKSFLD